MIALVDYGAGNLASVRKGFAAAGADLATALKPSDLADASAVVVPGVGHFAATTSLGGAWRETIRQMLGRGVPLLGICLGLQWLFEGSEEAPDVPGLSVLQGRCTRLPSDRKVPHVGWNSLVIRPSRLLDGVPDGTYAYFTHSYAAPISPACTAVTEYGMAFAAAVEHEHVFGVQFHPEKSGPAGIRVLKNFVSLAGKS